MEKKKLNLLGKVLIVVIMAMSFLFMLKADENALSCVESNINVTPTSKLHFLFLENTPYYWRENIPGLWQIKGDDSGEVKNVCKYTVNDAIVLSDNIFISSTGKLTSIDNKIVRYFASTPSLLTVLENKLYFISENKLWKLSAVGDLSEIKIFDAKPDAITIVGNRLFVTVDSTLWVSDGTPDGTEQVFTGDIVSGSETAFNDKLFFIVSNGDVRDIYVSDGTVSGTVQLESVAKVYSSFLATESDLYLTFHSSLFPYNNIKPKFFDGIDHFSDVEGLNNTIAPFGILADNSIVYSDGALKLIDNEQKLETLKSISEDSFHIALLKGLNMKNLFNDYAVLNGKIYFAFDDNINGRELWVSDGTPAGTKLLKDIRTGGYSSGPVSFSVNGDFVYFVAYDDTDSYSIYKTDGAAITKITKVNLTNEGIDCSEMISKRGKLFFVNSVIKAPEYYESINQLLCFDKKQELKSLSQSYGYFSFLKHLIPVKDNIIYMVNDPFKATKDYDDMYGSGRLFVGINTESETLKLLLYSYGVGGASNRGKATPGMIFRPEGLYFMYQSSLGYGNFAMTDGETVDNLYTGDHSYAVIKERDNDIFVYTNGLFSSGNTYIYHTGKYTGDNSNLTETMIPVEGGCFDFTVDAGVYFCKTNDCWNLVQDSLHKLSNADCVASSYAVFNNELYFGKTQNEVCEFYKSDGTYEGTVKIFSIKSENGSRTPYVINNIRKFGDVVVYDINNSYPLFPPRQFVTDGTAEGTYENTDKAIPQKSFYMNDTIYYLKEISESQYGLFERKEVSGTEKEIVKLDAESVRFIDRTTENQLFVCSTESGEKLYSTDGTSEGTKVLFAGADIKIFKKKDNTLLFTCLNDKKNLFSTDGTVENTELLLKATEFSFVKDYNNFILLSALNDADSLLYATNGKNDGTFSLLPVSVGTISVVEIENNLLLFSKIDTFSQVIGITPGINGVPVAKQVISGQNCGEPFTVFNRVFFSLNTPVYGSELWSSDGVSASLVNDINPGAESSDPSNFTYSDDKLFFQADNGVDGRELYIVTWDGTNPEKIKSSINIAEKQVSEDIGEISATVSISQPLDEPVVVKLNFTGSAEFGADFTAPEEIVIPTGKLEQKFSICIIDDKMSEKDETILINPVFSKKIINTSQAELLILDNDIVCKVKYVAGENGFIFGDTEQVVPVGEDTTVVLAVADEGYQFVKWSDDSTENPRSDSEITKDVTFTAEFEPISCFTVSGKVIGDIQEGVTLNISGNNTVSDKTGAFSFEGLISGKCVIIPTKEGYIFTPAFMFVDIENQDITDLIFESEKICSFNPIAKDDNYSITMDGKLVISAPGVYENDTIPGDGSIEALITEYPQHGILDFGQEGNFAYIPNKGFNGKDSFSYVLTEKNGVSSDVAVVSLEVIAEKVTYGSVIRFNNVKVGDGSKFRLIGEMESNLKRFYLRSKMQGTSLETIWKRRVRLFFGNIATITSNLPFQSEKITFKLKKCNNKEANDKKQTLKKVLLVPPYINSVALDNDSIKMTGYYFGDRNLRLFLKPIGQGKIRRCKIQKNKIKFNQENGKSSFEAMIKRERIQPGKYFVILLNKLGVGVNADSNVSTDNTLPVIEIK
jgi:ELWxxDGT repeat protein